MYKFLLMFLLLVSSVIGCSTSPNTGTVMDTSVVIKYINQKGKDLLNPQNPHAITVQNTNLYRLVNGKKKKIYRSHLDHPKMFFIANDYDSTGEYKMYIGLLTPGDQNMTTTYIKFKNYPTDTLKVQYEINGAGTAITKVWYNGNLKWNVAQKRKRELTITKHFLTK